jgi:hypothetical protein
MHIYVCSLLSHSPTHVNVGTHTKITRLFHDHVRHHDILSSSHLLTSIMSMAKQ